GWRRCRYTACVRGGGKGGTGKPRAAQIAIRPLAGGEAWTLTDLPAGASNPVWSPDSKPIVFLSTTTPEDIAKAERKKKKPEDDSKSKESEAAKNTAEPKSPEPESEHESDAHVVNRAVYRDNDEG